MEVKTFRTIRDKDGFSKMEFFDGNLDMKGNDKEFVIQVSKLDKNMSGAAIGVRIDRSDIIEFAEELKKALEEMMANSPEWKYIKPLGD